jgi:hypothetical protein
MGVTAIGYENHVKDAVIVANSTDDTAVGLDPDQIANDQGSPQYAWQTAAGGVTLATGAFVKIAPRTPAQTWRAAGMFGTNLTPAATVNFTWWNENSGSPTSVASQTVNGPASSYGQVLYILPADITADFLQIYVEDASNPDNHINVPLVFAGPLWIPEFGRSFRSSFGRIDRTDQQQTQGGQEFPLPRWQKRYVTLDFDATSVSNELWQDAMEIDRIARLGGNILAIPDIGASDVNYAAVFGQLKTSDQMSYGMRTAARVAWNARVTERL